MMGNKEIELIEQFKSREIKAKEVFEIREVSKKQATDIVAKFHYLGTKKFMYTVAYGLFIKGNDELLGCATFGVVGGIIGLKGWFGLDNSHSDEFFELNRLVMNPILNGCNATSFLLGNSIKQIKKTRPTIKAIVSLADDTKHKGYIYQACNFTYYGLTDKKTDFIREGQTDLTPRRGATKGCDGYWIARSRKRRYLYVIDDTIEVLYDKLPYPKGGEYEVLDCCENTNVIVDKRTNVCYTCVRCFGICRRLTDDELKYFKLNGRIENDKY